MTSPQLSAVLVECACGKGRYVFGEEWVVRLARVSLCRSCEAEHNRTTNSCPEGVPILGGSTVCRLGWDHTGTCEPVITNADIAALAGRHADHRHAGGSR